MTGMTKSRKINHNRGQKTKRRGPRSDCTFALKWAQVRLTFSTPGEGSKYGPDHESEEKQRRREWTKVHEDCLLLVSRHKTGPPGVYGAEWFTLQRFGPAKQEEQ